MELEVLEPDVLDLEAGLSEVDLVTLQETQIEPVSIDPQIQNRF